MWNKEKFTMIENLMEQMSKFDPNKNFHALTLSSTYAICISHIVIFPVKLTSFQAIMLTVLQHGILKKTLTYVDSKFLSNGNKGE